MADRRWFQWRGTRPIVENEVIPAMRKKGATITSRKRWTSFGNWLSDHWRGNRDAYAADGWKGSQKQHEGLGIAAGKALKVPYRGIQDDYKSFYIKRKWGGKMRRFRVQIIARTHGTGPHCHVGVKRA